VRRRSFAAGVAVCSLASGEGAASVGACSLSRGALEYIDSRSGRTSICGNANASDALETSIGGRQVCSGAIAGRGAHVATEGLGRGEDGYKHCDLDKLHH
jgi:hypothetical protein